MKRSLMWRRIAISVAVLHLTAPSPGAASEIFESFEQGFGAWSPDADMPPTYPYSVTRTKDRAFDGTWSLDFTADGHADDGTVWVFRELHMPAGTWIVGLEFWFWSQGSDFNNWRVVAYIGLERPAVEADFTNVGYAGIEGWSPYSLEEEIVLAVPTTVYVAFGYSINWETIRTHWFDAVTITGVPCDPPPGDMDYDCDVDLNDFATFALCFGGQVGAPPAPCTVEQAGAADLDDSGVIDLNDFATFAVRFTG